MVTTYMAGEPGLPTPSSHSSSWEGTLRAKEESPSCHRKWPGRMRPQESALGSLQSKSPVGGNSGVWVGLGHLVWP